MIVKIENCLFNFEMIKCIVEKNDKNDNRKYLIITFIDESDIILYTTINKVKFIKVIENESISNII